MKDALRCLALNQDQEEIKNHPKRISNIQPFFNKYNQNGVNFPISRSNFREFEIDNPDITLVVNLRYLKIMMENMPTCTNQSNKHIYQNVILKMGSYVFCLSEV